MIDVNVNICPKCGKFLWFLSTVGNENSIRPEDFCHCKIEKSNPALQGWQCPVCGAVYAPWVASCGNTHVKLTYSNFTSKA